MTSSMQAEEEDGLLLLVTVQGFLVGRVLPLRASALVSEGRFRCIDRWVGEIWLKLQDCS